jgi:uncharacterized protein YneF (UPF0154 family)
MENLLAVLLLGVSFGMGIVVGMYILTQISGWIEKRIKKK